MRVFEILQEISSTEHFWFTKTDKNISELIPFLTVAATFIIVKITTKMAFIVFSCDNCQIGIQATFL